MDNERISLGGAQKQPNNQNDEIKNLAKQHDIPEQFIERESEFQVPTEEIELPSGGVFYSNGKSTVKIKYLTAEEDNILFSPDLIKSGKVLDILLESAVLDKDLRPEDMLSGDRNYLLIATRRTGFGDEYEPGEMTCESCNNKFNPVVDLSKLQPKKLEVMPETEEGWYSVQMPVMKMTIKFRFLRGSDEKRMRKSQESSGKKTGQFKISRLITDRYLLQIMEVNGNRDKLYIQKFINAMPTKDSLFFREYVRRIEPGIDLSYDFECPHCGHIETTDVPITAKLFYPEADV